MREALEQHDGEGEGEDIRGYRCERSRERRALAVGDRDQRDAEVAGIGERRVQRAQGVLRAAAFLEHLRNDEPNGRGAERRRHHAEHEPARKDLLERAAVDRHE